MKNKILIHNHENRKLLGILAGIFTTATFLSCQNKEVSEIYILKNNYLGPVIVKFNDANGSDEKFDNEGNRVFEIPSSGLLKTKFKFQEGWRDIKYVREDGSQLRYLWPGDKVWQDTLNKGKANDSVYVYHAEYAKDYWFIVGKICNSDSLSNEMHRKWMPLSKPITLKEGDSIGQVRHNKEF
jgi:hypothetical protein